MKSCAIFSLIPCFRLTYHVKLGTAPGYLPFFFFTRCLGERLYTSGSTNNRPFPDYSPKKPTIRNAELVYQISTAKVTPVRLVLDFFDWACLCRDPNLESYLSYAHFVERLIYTYKDWGSDPYVFDVFFQVLAEAGMLNEARNFFDTIGCLLNIMIHCICRLGKIKEAHLLLLRMELRGFIPDVVMLKLIEEMQVKRLKPNSFTYNSIILFLCETVKIVEVKKVLREIRNWGILLDNVIYTTLIGGCCKLGDIATAHKLFKKIKGLKLVPDLITYTAIISGFCQTGKMVEAHKLFHEMLSKGLKPDVVTYTALIDSYCKASEMKEAFLLHNHMVQMGLTPNVEVNTASELLHEMCQKGLQLNICTYNSIVNAMKLMEDMRVAGFPPDTLTYTTLMDAYSKSEEMVKAHKLVREMLYKWLPPTVVTFNVLMNGFCISRMLEDGERLLKGMLEKGIMPNATTYNCLMKQHSIRNNMVTIAIYKGMWHSKARNMKEAWFLHREMVRKGFTLTVTSYNALIKGFLKRKKLLEARQLFEEMRREGLFAEREIITSLLMKILKRGT
ncbi:hypothetical protein ACOSQ2_018479 [Xanthoceras sorbifolium]